MIAKSLGKGVRKILDPTNKAALNIGGSTIHKFLKMTKEGYISPKLLKGTYHRNYWEMPVYYCR
jgi:hypothetical protein